ncbi:hypothetical protein HY485_05190 [Candidatus Woesearchaeota archaeon]|nr:hypothetical protein [Candidatus Woesearchaeota archaeon]
MRCTLYNIPSCVASTLRDTAREVIQYLLNAPVQPLIGAVRLLLTQPPAQESFQSLWQTIVYVLSVFYGLFVLFAGLLFIVFSTNPSSRARAKEWLQNSILAMIFVQASYYLYSLIAHMSAGLTQGVLAMLDPSFFFFDLQNIQELGTQIIFGILYIIALVITVFVLGIVYFLSSIGVVFFPFGLFLYFVPPLKFVGKFIINSLLFVLFIPFFVSLVFLTTSRIILLPAFSNIKILLLTIALLLADLITPIIMLLVIIHSIINPAKSTIVRPLTHIKNIMMPKKQKTLRPLEHDKEYWGTPHQDPPRKEEQ